MFDHFVKPVLKNYFAIYGKKIKSLSELVDLLPVKNRRFRKTLKARFAACNKRYGLSVADFVAALEK